MIKKHRIPSEELQILTLLNKRIDLPAKDKQHFMYLNKGFEGEVLFDEWFSSLEPESLILNDLLFEVGSSFFQIDSLAILQDTLYFFEVKNYEGEYFYEGDVLKTRAGNDVKDPLLQLRRSETLLRQMLKNFNYTTNLEVYVIFINPEFTLYQGSIKSTHHSTKSDESIHEKT